MLNTFEGFEDLELGTVLPLAGLILGVVFGVLAQRSRFCLRSAVIESGGGRGLAPMAGVYAAAVAAAVLGTLALTASGWVSLDDTRFFSDTLPLGALVLGGLMFGAGMVLTRGCASRLTVLSAQGNLRAVLVVLVFGMVAYAALRGVLAAPRMAFTEATGVEVVGQGSLPALLGLPGWLVAAAVAALALVVVALARPRPLPLAAGALIGLVVVGGWFASGALLFDEFDPQAADSLAFTAGVSDGVFWLMASTALEPSFAAGLVGGVLLGAFVAAAASRELRLESFEGPRQTLRYLAGGALMGVGGVMAGGCTIGAGLTGTSTLALGPFVALAGIVVGAKATQRLLDRDPAAERVVMVPAE